jgi:hypothetical protein
MWETNEKGSGNFHFTFSNPLRALAWEVLTEKAILEINDIEHLIVLLTLISMVLQRILFGRDGLRPEGYGKMTYSSSKVNYVRERLKF